MAIYQYVNGYPTLVGYGGDPGQALATYATTGIPQADPNMKGITPHGTPASPGASSAQGGASGGGVNNFYQLAGQAISSTPQVASPSLTYQGLTPASLAYPQYMRAQGENMAQQAYQNQVNQGIRQGNAGNAYTQALNARNNARLGYMGQAGQAQLGVDTAGAGLLNDYQRLLLSRYGGDISQRGQNIDMYRSALTGSIQSALQDSARPGISMGGSLTTANNNKDQGDAGVFKGMGNVNIGYSPSNYGSGVGRYTLGTADNGKAIQGPVFNI